MIDAQAFESFRTKGYTVKSAILDSNELETFSSELQRLGETVDQPGSVHYGERDSFGNLIYLNRLDVASDFFFDTARHPKFMGLAETLLGKAVVPLHVECFSKPPTSRYATPPHQDQVFYHAHFHDELAIALWIALDDVTPESGALQYVPTAISECRLLAHVGSASASFDMELVPEVAQAMTSYEVVPVPRGGCAIHHSFVVHRAGPNVTSRDRRAVVFNYRGSPYRQSLLPLAAQA